jgi:hypothetical protein
MYNNFGMILGVWSSKSDRSTILVEAKSACLSLKNYLFKLDKVNPVPKDPSVSSSTEIHRSTEYESLKLLHQLSVKSLSADMKTKQDALIAKTIEHQNIRKQESVLGALLLNTLLTQMTQGAMTVLSTILESSYVDGIIPMRTIRSYETQLVTERLNEIILGNILAILIGDSAINATIASLSEQKIENHLNCPYALMHYLTNDTHTTLDATYLTPLSQDSAVLEKIKKSEIDCLGLKTNLLNNLSADPKIQEYLKLGYIMSAVVAGEVNALFACQLPKDFSRESLQSATNLMQNLEVQIIQSANLYAYIMPSVAKQSKDEHH